MRESLKEAYRKRPVSEYPLTDTIRSCVQCCRGVHDECTGNAAADGATWAYIDKRTNLPVKGSQFDRKWASDLNVERRFVRIKDGKIIPRRPCGCEEAGHPIADTCCVYTQGDSWGQGYDRCGKPAKGVTPIDVLGHASTRGPEVPACGTHMGVTRRLRKNEAERKARNDAREAKWERERANTRASRDWAERLRSEFGVDAHPAGGGRLVVEIGPEPLYRILDEAARLLDETVGPEQNPLRGNR